MVPAPSSPSMDLDTFCPTLAPTALQTATMPEQGSEVANGHTAHGSAPYLVIVASVVVVVRWIAKTSTAPLEPARSQPLIPVPPGKHASCARCTPCPRAGRRGTYALPRMPPRPSSRPPAMSPMPARTPSPASPATAPAASAVCGMLGSRGSSGFFASSTLGLASTS